MRVVQNPQMQIGEIDISQIKFSLKSRDVRIPVNVTADSGNVTGNSGERDRGSVLRVWILCRFVFPAVFPVLNWLVFE